MAALPRLQQKAAEQASPVSAVAQSPGSRRDGRAAAEARARPVTRVICRHCLRWVSPNLGFKPGAGGCCTLVDGRDGRCFGTSVLSNRSGHSLAMSSIASLKLVDVYWQIR